MAIGRAKNFIYTAYKLDAISFMHVGKRSGSIVHHELSNPPRYNLSLQTKVFRLFKVM